MKSPWMWTATTPSSHFHPALISQQPPSRPSRSVWHKTRQLTTNQRSRHRMRTINQKARKGKNFLQPMSELRSGPVLSTQGSTVQQIMHHKAYTCTYDIVLIIGWSYYWKSVYHLALVSQVRFVCDSVGISYGEPYETGCDWYKMLLSSFTWS